MFHEIEVFVLGSEVWFLEEVFDFVRCTPERITNCSRIYAPQENLDFAYAVLDWHGLHSAFEAEDIYINQQALHISH